MRLTLFALGLMTLLAQDIFAATDTFQAPLLPPQPVACISGTFSTSGTADWTNFTLELTNNCGKPVDFQNTLGTFVNGVALNTTFWGDFAPLSYPDNELKLTATPQSDGKFLETFNLHFPTDPSAVSVLPAGKSIKLYWGASQKSTQGPVTIYMNTPVETGTLALTNASEKPANVLQNYALVHLTLNGKKVSDIQLPWNSTQNVTGLVPGLYSVSADSVSSSAGIQYQGTATPASVNLAADQIARVTISYTQIPQTGKASIQLPSLPPELTGYTGQPTAVLTLAGSGSSVSQILNWNSTTLVSQLINGGTYTLSTPTISFNGFQCLPQFNPTSLIAHSTNIPLTVLTYTCTKIVLNDVKLNVTGAPSTLSSLKVTLTPTTGTTVSSVVSLTNGSGSSIIKLPSGVIYQVSSDTVPGYSITYNPQPLTSTPSAIENIILAQDSGTALINVTSSLQPIDGFGFSTAWCPVMTTAQGNILFGTGKGQLGFSMLRIRIDPYEKWANETANAAIAHSYGAKVLGTPWTPPPPFKNNVSDICGNLLPSHYGNYAAHLQRAAKAINLDYVSFQNEPDWCPQNPGWESCNPVPQEILNWILNYAPSIGKPIVVSESLNFKDTYTDPILNNSQAASYVTYIAGHFYGNGNYVHQNALNHGKHVWQTEHYINGKDISAAMKVAKEVSDAMKNQFSAYFWWWIRPNAENSFIQGTTVDLRGYVMGQFAHWIRPGKVRCSATYNPQPNIYVTAYSNNGLVIVALNMGTSSVNQKFTIQNASGISLLTPIRTSADERMVQLSTVPVNNNTFTYSLPGQSITTFAQYP